MFQGFRLSGGARQCANLMQIKEFCRTPLRSGAGMTGGLGASPSGASRHGQPPIRAPKLCVNQTRPMMAGQNRRAGAMNHLYYGDNLNVLRESIKTESVDLIYLDPPFNSNASYNVLFRGPVEGDARAEV